MNIYFFYNILVNVEGVSFSISANFVFRESTVTVHFCVIFIPFQFRGRVTCVQGFTCVNIQSSAVLTTRLAFCTENNPILWLGEQKHSEIVIQQRFLVCQ